MAALDEPTKSTKPTTPRRKAHQGLRGSVRKAARRFRPHPSPSAFRAGVVDVVGIVDFVEGPERGNGLPGVRPAGFSGRLCGMTDTSSKLFSRPIGGYRHLDSFTLATIIQIETWRFCQTFLDLRNDPKGRWFDQMTQAARSGRANLIEGSENAATSKEESADAFGVKLDPMPHGDDIVRDSALHARTQRAKFARWLDDPDPCVRANCLLVLIRRAILVFRSQIRGLGEDFSKTGGLREQMAAARLEVRTRQREQPATEGVPLCPKCGKPMRKRTKRDSGESFWGCSAYAEGCRGTRPIS